MPKFNGKIIAVENNGAPVWQSPDGQRKIFNITVESNGRVLSCKTWDQPLAVVGFAGEIEAYDKQDNRGNNETWLALPKQQQQGGYQRNGGQRSNYVPRDDAAIKAMWAIGQAVEWFGGAKEAVPGTMDEAIEGQAHMFFEMVDRIKTGAAPGPQAPAAVTEAFGASEMLQEDGSAPWSNNQTQPQNNNLPL